MKLKSMVFILLSCIILLSGCEVNKVSNEKIYSLSEIKNSVENSGYTVENSDYIDGGYDVGNECISILIPLEDDGYIFCFVSSYKDEVTAQKVAKKIEKESLHDYILNSNIIAIYPSNYRNLDSIFANILSCNPDPYGTVFAKSK